MDAKKRILDLASYLILGTAFIWPLVMNILSATFIEYEPDRLVFLIAFLLLIFYGITYNKVTVIALFSAILLFSVVVALNVFIGDEPTEFVVSLYSYFEHVIRVIFGYLPYTPEYGGDIVWLLTILLVIFTGIFLKISFSFAALLSFGAAVFAINFISEYYTSELYFGVFVVAILALFMKRMNLMSQNGIKKLLNSQKNAEPEEKGRKSTNEHRSPALVNNALYALCIIPLCAVIVISSIVMPKPGDDFTTSRLSEKLQSINYAVSDWLYVAFNPRYFSFRSTGFGQANGMLGGNVNLNNREVMRVTAPSAIKLTGSIQSIYTGTSWDVPEDNETKPMDSSLQFSSAASALEYLFTRTLYEYSDLIFEKKNADATGIETNTYVSTATGTSTIQLNAAYTSIYKPDKVPLDRPPRFIESPQGYMFIINPETADVTVDILGRRTYSVFTPMYYYGNNAEFQLNKDSNGAMTASELLPANTRYSFNYFPQTSDKIAEQAESVDGDYLAFAREFLNRSGHEIDAAQSASFYAFAFNNVIFPYQTLLENLQTYRDSVYEEYLQLPETLPERVVELSIALTEGYSNDYDKVKAIENYLQQFEYTLRPGFVPEGRDFVDYFLFDGQQGYCTYFATSLAVMARAAGIPTRYAEGYALDPKSKQNGVYSVKNSTAHAWTEAYIQGFGWVQFEATPPYRELEEAVSTAVGYLDTTTLKLTQRETPDDWFEDEPGKPTSRNNEPQAQQEVTIDTSALGIYFAEAVLLALLIVALLILTRFLIRRRFFRKADKLNNRGACLYYYEALRRFFKYYGYQKYDHETLTQFAVRLTHPDNLRFYLEDSNLFIFNMMATLSKIHYSESEVTDYELSQIRGVYTHFDRTFAREHKWYQKIYHRYFTGRVY